MASVAITMSASWNCKELGSVADEITAQVNAKLKMKSVQKTIGMESDTQSTCHSEWHDTFVTVVSGYWHKNWPCLKGDDLMDCNTLSLQQGKSQLLYGSLLIRWHRYWHMSSIPTYPPKTKTLWVRQKSNMEKLICNLRQTRKEHKSELPAHF